MPFADVEETCRQLVLPLPAKLSSVAGPQLARVYRDGRCTARIGGAEVSLLQGKATLWPRDSRLMWLRFLRSVSQRWRVSPPRD